MKPIQQIFRPFHQAILLSLWITLSIIGNAAASSIAVTGNWSPAVDAGNLQAGAGSNLASSEESSIAQAAITISGTLNSTSAWRVDVQRSDNIWPASLNLSLKRNSDGVGPGTITGGGSYGALTAIPTTFFSGQGDRSGVSFQFQLSGISISIPPGTYSTTLTYTVIDLG